jgi:hypothetical protein
VDWRIIARSPCEMWANRTAGTCHDAHIGASGRCHDENQKSSKERTPHCSP